MKKIILIVSAVILSIGIIGLLMSKTIFSDKKPNQNYTWKENGDTEIIRGRMLEDLMDDSADPSAILADLQADGSFASVDYYTDQQDYWHPIDHLDNILTMEIAVNSTGNQYYGSMELQNGIKKAIEFWVQKNFYCDWNDWWNNLGIGPKIADILLFPNEEIEQANLDTLSDKLYQGTVFEETRKYNVKEREINSTGGNLTDTVNYSLKYAVIKGDGEKIKFLLNLMENEMRPFPSVKFLQKRWDAEGIKADMSFQQHFELLYMGGYGETFALGTNTYIRYTDGTQFALSDKSMNFYQDFLLDGLQYAMRGKYRDINASGRGIVREGNSVGIYQFVIDGANVLLDSSANLTRESDLELLLSTRNEASDQGAGGHKYFWNSDYQVYNNTEYMATVRAASDRTKNSEALNGENVLGHYLGAGATMYYLKGDEYFDIFPLWNWNRIPGTTTLQGYLPIGDDSTYTRMGKTSFVGGVSNGTVGMSAINYKDNRVKAKKSWFMFKEGVVNLGTDISSRYDKDVYTTMNQSLLRGDVEYSQGNELNSQSQMDAIEIFDWIYNNGIGYVTNSPVTIQAGQRTGDWKTISTRSEEKTHSDTVLELGISHGADAKNEKYDYTVLMNTTPSQLAEYTANPTMHTLSNNSSVQAVWDESTDTFMAVFWEKGSLDLPNGEKLSVSEGCTIIVEPDGEQYSVYVNDPEQDGGTLTVSIGELTGKVHFERGMYAGKSEKVELE